MMTRDAPKTAVDEAIANVAFFAEHIADVDTRCSFKMALAELVQEVRSDADRRVVISERRRSYKNAPVK